MATKQTSQVLFASARPRQLEQDQTLPARFKRLLERLPLRERVKDRTVAIKMHLGGGIGYSTIHPLFVKILVDHVKSGKPRDVFVCDASVKGASDRGYAPSTIGARLVPAIGEDGTDVVTKRTLWKHVESVQIGRPVLEADVLVNFSHVKGHGDCGFGGACKNLAMGCVPQTVRAKMHSLEGKLVWDKALCAHCKKCIEACPTKANSFSDSGEYEIFWHHCRMCLHCMLACPTHAIGMINHNFDRFQECLARVAKLVLDAFKPGLVFHINVLTQITIFCDCWGFTTPALVPDIGIMAGEDIVAVDHASLKAIKTADLIPGSITPPYKLRKGRHLFEKIHGKDPFVQVGALERLGAGSANYRVIETL